MITGKVLYVWQAKKVGTPSDMLAYAKRAGASLVMLKIANGTSPYGGEWSGTTFKDFTAPYVDTLQASGIEVGGWHYVYGYSPAAEAEIALSRVKELGVEYYVIDAETEYKGRTASAVTYASAIRKRMSVPSYLSSYRYPDLHRTLPWRELGDCVVGNMPQLYWEGAHNPRYQLTESQRQYDKWFPGMEYIPIAPAYARGSWEPALTDYDEFIDTAKLLPAVGWYSLDWLVANARWDWLAKITGAPFYHEDPPPSDRELLEKLLREARARGWDV